MTSPDMHTLAGAFALDALDDVERARFQRHLQECTACSEEVRELRATAARLGMAVAVDPPADFRDRVLAEVRATRQDPPDAEPGPAEKSRRSSGTPRWVLGLAVAAAVAGLALGGVSAGIALNATDELTVAQSQLDEARNKYSPVADLLSAPDVHTAYGEATSGGSGTVIVSQSRDQMMFMGTEMPPRPPGKDYQLWLMDPDGVPRSAGIVGDSGSRPLLLADGIKGMVRVALTVEPEGGSAQPTAAPILMVGMPA